MRNKLNPDSPWPERDDELREVWNWRGPNGEHWSQAEVARKMKLTKGCVCGRARRLGLFALSTDRTLVRPPSPTRYQPSEGEPARSVVKVSRSRALVRINSSEKFHEVRITEDFGRLWWMEPARRKPPMCRPSAARLLSTLPPLPSLQGLE